MSSLTLAALTCYGLLILADRVISSRPTWWSPPDARSALVITTAERFEKRVTDALSAWREPEEEWTLTLSDEEASAWIAARLPMWLEAEGVEWGMSGRPVDLAFEEGRVLVGVPMTGRWQRRRTRVVVAELFLGVGHGGGLVVRLDGVTLGQLPLPDAWAKGHLQAAAARASLDPDLVLALMTGDRALREASLPIDGHRVVRFEGIRVDDGAITLTCSTQPRAHASR